MNTTATETSPEHLRALMVERICAEQTLRPEVRAALLNVERHRYVPDADLHTAYDEVAVITHTFPDGTHLSCASGPKIVAAMLNALQVQPGDTVLEIGAGTGYNAALLDTLTGPDGTVVTVDINASVTAGACRHLDDTGHPQVTVLTRDGAHGAAEHGPYDRIIVTVGAWDIPHTWWDQLRPGGRLVVPLRWRGTTRAVALVKGTDRWEDDWMFLCGFVPMLGQNGEHHATIDPGGHVSLYFDADQPLELATLQGVLTGESATVWTDVTVHGEEPFDRIWLRLTVSDPMTVRIEADNHAVTTGLCTPAIPSRSPAIVSNDSLAYFAIRRADQPRRWQLGATYHGPTGAALAERMVAQINAWSTARNADPTLTVFPSTTHVIDEPGATTIRKPESTLVLCC